MRKNSDPLKTAYADTPAAALAALAVGAFARCDPPDMTRTAEALMGKNRSRGERAEFVWRTHALTESALLWAVDAWRAYARIVELTAVLASPGAEEMPVGSAGFMKNAWNAKLASLIDAQKEICRRNGMVFEDVAGIASLSEMCARDEDAKPIPKLVDELIEHYSVVQAVRRSLERCRFGVLMPFADAGGLFYGECITERTETVMERMTIDPA